MSRFKIEVSNSKGKRDGIAAHRMVTVITTMMMDNSNRAKIDQTQHRQP
jgi:hypothetical protein